MADIECPRCGAMMPTGGVCPVCETPHAVSAASRTTGHDLGPASPVARWWRGGQLPVLLAAASYLGATMLPLMSGVPLRTGSAVSLDVTVRPLDLALGTYPAMRGQMTAWLLPGAAIFLLQILRSRRTGNEMAASRPLLGVLAIAPIVSVAMPFLRLHRLAVSPTPGAALGLVVLGSALCVFAALRFGHGVPEAAPRKRVRYDQIED